MMVNDLVAHIRSGFWTREVKAITDALSDLQSIILKIMVHSTKVRMQNAELKNQVEELKEKTMLRKDQHQNFQQ